MTQDNLKLVYAEATHVLGEYNHTLDFSEQTEFVIIYGPNGVGKTKFLEIVHALSRLDGTSLSRMPFATATLHFSDGTTLSVAANEEAVAAERPGGPASLQFRIDHPTGDTSLWKYSGEGFADWLVENTPWRPYDDDDTWEDRRDGEIAHLIELRQRYPDGERRSRPPTPEFRQLQQRVASYLIETQRLRIEQAQSRRGVSWNHNPRQRHSSKITEHAAKMKSLVNDAQTEHSTITQQLDRTFPNRVLSWSPAAQDADTVRRRYEEQNTFRSRLGQVASVELADALSLPDRLLADWELRLLDLYLDDADAKLAPFEMLLQKIELLEEIVNSRLLNKRLQVTAREGLAVLHQSDLRSIELDSLSSGEQHEVILMFDLLFNVPAGALVLIDEPEISLHVVWQLAFIPDVRRIAALSGFRFVVATHSPQIINDSWDRAVRLGPEEVPFS